MKSAQHSWEQVHGIIMAFKNRLNTPWHKFHVINLMLHSNIMEKFLHFISIYVY
jgi:hypothetical protein